jgi:CRP/FNR family transcriptional regulator, cyclic AMP receptor protein
MEDTGGALSRRVSETALVLQHDRELGDTVQAEQREAAARASAARVLRVASGRWDACAAAGPARGGHGLLVLAGLLVRQVGLNERVASELLGPGDLLRPLEHDGEEATLPFAAAWRVLKPLRLAVLDRRWSVRMCAFPDVGIALTGRAMARSRRLANMFVIASYPHLEDRLWLVLWELADRYGRVRPDGVHVPVAMTHQVLSELAVARRPSVSSALSRLAGNRSVERLRDGWLLRGDPPPLVARSRDDPAAPEFSGGGARHE